LALLNIPGIAFYSLQKGVQAGEFAHLPSEVPLQDLSSQLNDFADTATVVTQLDLIITVDTAVAHLAGALGRPVWVLLSHWCDWRWMIEREDSPWYPTIRLFRQHQAGDWAGVFERVAEALVKFAS
jgi:ADP-heptose:LPS heptosyltransferase